MANYDQTVKVWHAVTGHETLGLKGHSGRVQSVALSPNGRHFAVSGDPTVKIWDAGDGATGVKAKDQQESDVTFARLTLKYDQKGPSERTAP